MTTLQVEAAAVREVSGTVYALAQPARHHNVLHLMHERGVKPDSSDWGQGFLLNNGRYVNRKQAAMVALRAGQIKNIPIENDRDYLLSEDLW